MPQTINNKEEINKIDILPNDKHMTKESSTDYKGECYQVLRSIDHWLCCIFILTFVLSTGVSFLFLML